MADPIKIVDLFGNSIEQEEEQANNADLSSTLLGRYAEFMVCAQLTKAGYDVMHVDAKGFDLVLTTDEGSFTIQVKSSNVIVNGRCQWNIMKATDASNGGRNRLRTRRRFSPADAHLIALFQLTFGTTIIIPVTNNMQGSISFPVHQVEQASVEETLEQSIKLLSI